MGTSAQESRWVLLAQCGDREALEALLRATYPWLRSYLYSLAGKSDADDLVQEVLILVCRNVGCLRTPELFRPWVYRIASRAAFRHICKRRRNPEAYEDPAVLEQLPDPAASAAGMLLPGLLEVGPVPPASRAVLALHFAQQLPLAEVAAILGIPSGTVKSRLAAGLAALRRHLERKGKANV